MKKSKILSLLTIVCVAAFTNAGAETMSGQSFIERLNVGFQKVSALAAKAKDSFHLDWNGSEYICRNSEGRLGYNKLESRELLRTKNGECSDLTGMSLRYVDLMGANLDGALLERSDMTGANLHGASLNGANLTKALLSVANLGGAQLIAVNAVDTDFSAAVLNDAKLTKAHLTQANLSAAHLVAAELSGADLRHADLEKTHLEKATYDSQTKLPFDDGAARLRGMWKIYR